MMLTHDRTEIFSRRLQAAVEERLAATGLSARQVSLAVVGHDGLIRDIRAGRIPSADRIEALCEYLGLEFYVGPPRRAPSNHDLIERLAMVEGKAFVSLPLYGAELSAGPGAKNDSDDVVERLAFRREWLAKIGVSPACAVLVKVRGESMAPTLHPGDLVLIDKNRREIVSGQVFAFVDKDGDTRVKRLERVDRSTLVLRSDNPEVPLELRRAAELNALRIIGQVVWSGHRWV